MRTVIKLQVPEKVAAETVSQGNFDAELTPGGIVVTPSRRFADWLIETHELTEIGTVVVDDDGNEVNPLEAEYPLHFPKREVFIKLGMPFAQVRGLALEDLLKIKGIAEKTAEVILNFDPAIPENQAEENSVDGGGE